NGPGRVAGQPAGPPRRPGDPAGRPGADGQDPRGVLGPQAGGWTGRPAVVHARRRATRPRRDHLALGRTRRSIGGDGRGDVLPARYRAARRSRSPAPGLAVRVVLLPATGAARP